MAASTTHTSKVGTMLADASKQQSIKLSSPKGQSVQQAKDVPSKQVGNSGQQKNVPRRSSKPIINWFQRKLTRTGRAKRAGKANTAVELGLGRGRVVPSSTRAAPRIASSPIPVPSPRPQGRLDIPRRKTVSLNGDDDSRNLADVDDNSMDRSSLARESTWSPASVLEADDDASVRPIPPSGPPSPSPSSSSYLSDPRTFRSIAASTKPTTVLSIDLNGNGMAHIAQAPITPPFQVNRLYPHMRTSSSATNPGLFSSGASITFSPFPQSSSRPSSLTHPSSPGPQPGPMLAVPSVQAPQHTAHHPRNNPRPSSPPLDNASVLTLASSAYAVPGLRPGVGHSATASARGIGDSLSHFGGSITFPDAESTSQFVVGDDDRLEERDVDASVRALRPRSSRRGSWESEASRWSARDQLGTGSPSLARERSLWTANSVRTGGLSMENTGTFDQSDEAVNGDEHSREDVSEPKHTTRLISPSITNDSEPTSAMITNPPPDASRRFSTDTVAQQVPDFDATAKADIPMTTISSEAQMDIKVSKSHVLHAENRDKP
ncbi:hypothetical protein L208DRAFT_1423122 [Tricholoma matsutake]|nr:hypothetical protein L208DRAFT_1423122 [Tricholoma matsutake 945]